MKWFRRFLAFFRGDGLFQSGDGTFIVPKGVMYLKISSSGGGGAGSAPHHDEIGWEEVSDPKKPKTCFFHEPK